jgi:hypothetical protein
MTMGVGFVCEDGVVISADRQLKSLNNFTYPECRLNGHKWVKGRAIWAYSGIADTAKRLHFELSKDDCFGQFSEVSEWSDVSERLDVALKRCLARKEVFQTLFAAWIEGARLPYLFLANGTRIIGVERCEVIGTADSQLTRFLRGMFLSFPSYPTIQQAINWAVYFILAAKTYDGQFVGNGTDVWFIDSNRQTHVMDPAWTEPWEKELRIMEFRTISLFGLLTHREIPAERIPRELEIFNSLAKEFCAKVREGRWR